MVMTLWPVAIGLLLLGVIVWAIAYANRRSRRREPVLVANTEFLDRIPRFVRAQRTARILQVLAVGVAVLGLVSASVLAGRVASERVESPQFASRDIVLCLDVSGSMYQYDTQILSTFAELTKSFHGERVGLSIYNSTSRTVFPLTNDYDLVSEQLTKAAKALDFDENSYRLGSRSYSSQQVQAYYDFITGTRGLKGEASMIPDGIAACGSLFDQSQKDRSRSVISATDNEVNGKPVFTLAEAIGSLKRRGATIYSFYPGAFECTSMSCRDELKAVTTKAGGRFYSSSDPGAIPQIIGEIQRDQAQIMGATPKVVRTDHPSVPFAFTLLALIGVVIVGWRARG